MQINFEAKKLKEANEYVELLNRKKIEKRKEQKIPKISFLKKFFNLLFK